MFVVNDLTTALQELASHLASVGIDEQDNAVLLRYFSFGLHRLVQFEQEKNALFASN